MLFQTSVPPTDDNCFTYQKWALLNILKVHMHKTQNLVYFL